MSAIPPDGHTTYRSRWRDEPGAPVVTHVAESARIELARGWIPDRFSRPSPSPSFGWTLHCQIRGSGVALRSGWDLNPRWTGHVHTRFRGERTRPDYATTPFAEPGVPSAGTTPTDQDSLPAGRQRAPGACGRVFPPRSRSALRLVLSPGLEPGRPCGHRHLKPARIPIPPREHVLEAMGRPYLSSRCRPAICLSARCFERPASCAGGWGDGIPSSRRERDLNPQDGCPSPP